MVDYDVLPLRSHRQSAWATEEAADGKFTAFQSHVPALLHGAASEWDRVAQLLSSVPWQRIGSGTLSTSATMAGRTSQTCTRSLITLERARYGPRIVVWSPLSNFSAGQGTRCDDES